MSLGFIEDRPKSVYGLSEEPSGIRYILGEKIWGGKKGYIEAGHKSRQLHLFHFGTNDA